MSHNSRDSSLLPDMIKVEQMGVSPPRTESKNGNHLPPKESTSQQFHELGSEYILTELSENTHQHGYAITQNEFAETATGVSCSGIHESSFEYTDKNSPPEHMRLLPKGASEHNPTGQCFCDQETVSGKTNEYGSGYGRDTSEKKHQTDSDIVQNKLEEALLGCTEPTVGVGSLNTGKELGEPTEQRLHIGSESSSNDIIESTSAISANTFNPALELDPEVMNQSNCGEHLQSPLVDPLRMSQEFASENPCIQQPRLNSEDMAQNSGVELHEKMPENLLMNSVQGRDGKNSKTRKKYKQRPLTKSDRVLRSKSQEKSKISELSNNLADVGPSEQQKSRNENKMVDKREVSDEYTRIKSHLRYLLNRINYERSLIAAYSTEGWKGLSLEKLKPEKELQRASIEILRRKLKIRDLFQHIDKLCSEGRLPESFFDSEGAIDSEDIFCAKCGSKDLSANNDIILCDGVCERGFHQYCLQPPLLKEDIPPGDERWFCPGCVCKIYCIELVNESQGTRFSLTDSWEKVFPEAAGAAGGQNQDPNFGLPSDDSNDEDYNANNSETDEKDQEDESSSDESDFTSASEELEVPPNVDPCLGLPSDDSEDDEYDPDGPDHDNVAKPESLSSDFTSDSEDLGAILEDNISSQKDAPVSISGAIDSVGQQPKLGKEPLSDELVLIMESASGQDDAALSKKRSSDRLDYKRLYDDTYCDVPSSSSDDEDWSDTNATRKWKKITTEASLAPENGNASPSRSVSISDALKMNPEENEQKPRRKSGSGGKRASSSMHRRLGETEKQRLYESFKENQYPDRATKERLCKELEMTFRQVSKWFENTRWSFNHPSSNQETAAKRV